MNEGGMTKIELLVIAGVVGLLGLIAIFAISSARSNTRDAVRLSDVRQAQIGLEMHFNATSAYPIAQTAIALGQPATFCLGDNGFSGSCSAPVFLETISTTPTAGLKEIVSCSEVANAYCYISDGEVFGIEFELEKNHSLMNLSKGVNCITGSGFKQGACQL